MPTGNDPANSAVAAPVRDNPFTRSLAGVIGLVFLALMVVVCLGSLAWTLGRAAPTPEEVAQGVTAGQPRYNDGQPSTGRLPPWWWGVSDPEDIRRCNGQADRATLERIAAAHGVTPADAVNAVTGPVAEELRRAWPQRQRRLEFLLGTDVLGRSLFIRCLTGGGISLLIGLAAALISVVIGAVYGSLAAYAGGLVDALMMRVVDVLYGLPYILLVVLLAVAVDAALDHAVARRVEAAGAARRAYVDRAVPGASDLDAARKRAESEAISIYGTGELSIGQENAVNVAVLVGAIGGISWLTMARVVRGQVLSLKAQPFMEAARAIGVPWWGQFRRHLLPNLVGPIVVYATLTVPQAILQESFLSFLGIGVRSPLPSWGNLAAEGLGELNTYKSHWWLLVFPCVLLASTLLALNFVGEGLREALDPRRSRR
jgi:ABC-type dipeptide/oligopeptide/nickel transport system permease subunit